MGARKGITLGLPDGRHIRKSTYRLLQSAGIQIPEYYPSKKIRKYNATFRLPSGIDCTIIIDKPRDLIYALASDSCDAIITGSDYIEDFRLFLEGTTKLGSILPIKEDIISAHIELKHLGYPGTQMAFLVSKNSPFGSLEELIKHKEKIICYTEFPAIASWYLQKQPIYIKKYGSLNPTMISTFSESGKNNKVIIIYSHGLTESKAAHSGNLVLDLFITGRTIKQNNLKILSYIGEPIYNLLYTRADMENDLALLELVSLLETCIKNNPRVYKVI